MSGTIEHKIITKKRFSTAVELLVVESRMTYLEAIVEVTEMNGIESTNVGNLITDSLKDKLEAEALALNLITGSKGNTLPV